MGRWKLIEWFESGRLELYDLHDDIGETQNLANSYPDKAAELHEVMNQWRARIHAPIPTTPNPRYSPDTSGQRE